jgi:two-component system sensor histidine kinase FlrB
MKQRGQELEQAFRAFSVVSEQLEASYRYLQERVLELTRELEGARAERRAKARQAEQLAQRLELLLATLPAGVVVLDAEGRIESCNPAAQSILGRELVGRRWTDVTAAAFESDSLKTGDAVTRDGRCVTAVSSASDREAGRIVLLNDVTEQRALETLVNRNDRLGAMGKMAASLAHQIRTPLASALLYLSQCRKLFLPTKYATAFEDGIERLNDINRLVRDMLVFARGGGPGETVDVAVLFDEVLAVVGAAANDAVALNIDLGEPSLTIVGNRCTLGAALSNLVTNAIESASGVTVTLRAAVVENEIVLSVVDDGPGIPEPLHRRVIEPFFSTRATGTGLGLAVAKTVAEAHDGRLELDSAVGRGTTASLILPLVSTVERARDDDRSYSEARYVA